MGAFRIFPIIERRGLVNKDILATLYEHIAIQISQLINIISPISQQVLITGGGAYNRYLINKIKAKTFHKVTIPNSLLVDFKEALIFAFLGLLRKEGQINCLSSVTGASRSHSSGSIY